ncbi:MAG: nuclear transport factor 2 family protein [Fimbriimonadaceae bacterium]|nr:nuclear transport factor 2 family protein [Fimbriimonadaceae bacterium]
MGDPVERQLEAYNARNVTAFVACYTEDVLVETGDGKAICRGAEAFRARYADAFSREPNVRCTISHRIRHGAYVVDHEYLEGYRDGSTREAVAIYRLAGDLIEHVRFL